MKRWMTGVNLLAFFAGLIMIAAMLVPWWSFQLDFSEQTDLYPYLLDGPGSEFVGYKRSPQMAILTGVLVVAIGLCFLGSFNTGRGSRIILWISGILIFLGAWRLLLRITDVAARFDLPIQGRTRGNYGGFAEVYVSTWLRPGMYLIGIAALLVLVAGLFQRKLWLQFKD
jgi:hypothetical protein